MNKVALITGGSSGIGKATAKLFSEKGYTVYELSRSGKTENGVIHIDCDITNEDAVITAINQVVNESGKIDVVINNAGFGISGAIEFTKIDDAKRIFDVNLFGVVRVTKAVLPELRKTKGGIVNVSSVAAELSIPFQGFYSATKSAINSLTLALRNEVKGQGVSICAVMPGDVKTGFTSAREKCELGEEVYKNRVKRSVSLMEKDETSGMQPEQIAKKLYKIANKKRVKPLFTLGFKYKLFVFLSKILPKSLVNRIVGSIYAK